MNKVFDDEVVRRAMLAAGRAALSGDLAIRAGKFVPPPNKELPVKVTGGLRQR
jgi:hypothetical protein